jgi:hypothetical protein
VFGFPVYSTFAFKAKLGGEISFATALLNVMVMFLFKDHARAIIPMAVLGLAVAGLASLL